MAILSLVQSAQEATGSTTSLAVTLGAAPTVGNLLVFYLMDAGSSTTITPPTGITRAALAANTSAGGLEVMLFYAVVDATLHGQTTFTFTASGAHTQALRCEEWSSTTGWPASPLDQTATADNGVFAATAALDTGSTPTTTKAVELWIGVVGYKGASQTPTGTTSGWTVTNVSNGTTISALFANQAVSAVGSAEWQGTLGTAELIAGAVATFAPNPPVLGAAAWTGTATVAVTASGPITLNGAASFTGSGNVQLGGGVPFRPEIKTTGGVQVVLAGQDITAYVDDASITMILALGQGPGVASGGAGRASSMQFLVRLGPVPTAKGAGEGPFSGTDLVRMGDLQVYDATGSQVFGGYAVDFEDATTTLEVRTKITATDYWQFLDRIMVNEVFAGQSDTQIISYLLTKYAPWVDQGQFPTASHYVFTKRYFRARTLRDTLQVVADVTGYNIWIDAARAIHYASLGALSTAPFSVSDAPDYVSTVPHVLTKYVQDDTSIVNQVYFYGGRNLSADYTQDLSVQANGNSTGFAILYYPHEAVDGAVHVTKNGTDLVAYSAIDKDPTHVLKRNGGIADVLINYDAETLEFSTAPLKTDTLTIKYRYETPLVMVLSSTASFQKFGQYFQAKIVDNNVFDSQTALQRCRVLLSEQAYGLTTLQLKTWKSGLQPGQLLYVKNAVRGLDGTYQVQRVEMRPLGAGFFEWTVDLGAWSWNLVDVLIWQQRTANATDDSLQETESVIQAQEAVFTSTVTVAWVKATRASGQYYSRTTASGDGHDAYSGFFSVTG